MGADLANMRFVSLRVLFVLICLVLAGIAEPSDGQIFVSSNDVPSIIGEYTLSGTPINPKLITGIAPPAAITIAGGNIFVANYTFGTIGEYSITGTPINTSLISGLNAPFSLQIDGSLMYVANSAQFQARQGSVGLYTTSGATVKSSFITGLSGPDSIAISDGKLYVLSLGVPGAHSGTLGVYDAVTGAVINANLISGLNSPEGLAISGQNVFIGVQLDGGIKEYDTSGALINSSFISDPDVWSIVAVGDKLFVGNTCSR